jgi:hypothetical protein
MAIDPKSLKLYKIPYGEKLSNRGYIYVAGATVKDEKGIARRISKVGVTSDLPARVNALRGIIKADVIVKYAVLIHTPFPAERAIHKELKKRGRGIPGLGEWYFLKNGDMEFIIEYAKNYEGDYRIDKEKLFAYLNGSRPPRKQWGPGYAACRGCGKTDRRHCALGYCQRCYQRIYYRMHRMVKPVA